MTVTGRLLHMGYEVSGGVSTMFQDDTWCPLGLVTLVRLTSGEVSAGKVTSGWVPA